jgi:hypothetical protein
MGIHSRLHSSFAVAIWAGCGFFVLVAWLASFRIYKHFGEAGIPINSNGEIVGHANSALVTIGFSILALLVAGIVSWLTWRTVWRISRT